MKVEKKVKPLDLHVEELAANGALLGGGIHVEDVPPQGELAPVLHLVEALVAAGHQVVGRLLEVEQPPLLDLEAVGAKLGVGHLLGQRRGARDHHGRAALGVRRREQGVEGRDPQAHQVRGRRQVRLVGHAARRIEANGPGVEELLQVGGQVARGAVVTRHHERGPPGLRVEERGEQVGAQAR